jgi:nickel transport protein
LRVRVLFRGKALADGEVERGDGKTKVTEKDIPKFRTDQDGIAAIPILKSSAQLLAIDHRVSPSLTPELAAADLYTAALWCSVRRTAICIDLPFNQPDVDGS